MSKIVSVRKFSRLSKLCLSSKWIIMLEVHCSSQRNQTFRLQAVRAKMPGSYISLYAVLVLQLRLMSLSKHVVWAGLTLGGSIFLGVMRKYCLVFVMVFGMPGIANTTGDRSSNSKHTFTARRMLWGPLSTRIDDSLGRFLRVLEIMSSVTNSSKYQ